MSRATQLSAVVLYGASSYIICESNAISRIHKVHHCFDSFEGLSEPTLADSSYWHGGDLKSSRDVLEDNLSPFSNVEIHQGWDSRKVFRG